MSRGRYDKVNAGDAAEISEHAGQQAAQGADDRFKNELNYSKKEENIMLQKISTDKAPAAIGPYSQGIVLGNIFFASGQIPIDPATGEIHGTTIEEQAGR